MLFVTFLLACAPGRPEPDLPRIECPFEEPADTVCHELQTPTGPVVVSLVPAEGRVRRDPLVLQNGGPGTSPWDDLGEVFSGPLRPLFGADRDLVLVETRGSRYGEEPMVCPAYTEALAGEASDDAVVSALFACFDAWHADGFDFSALAGARLADDIAAGVAGLGYDTFDYYGVSFGTIIGQHLLRDHGAHLGALALDGAVPLGTNYVDELPRNADAALVRLDVACGADQACTDAYGDLGQLLERRLGEVDAEPIVAVVEGTDEEVVIDGDGLAELVVQLLYFGSGAEYVPALLEVTGPRAAQAFGSVLSQIGGSDPWSEETVVGLNLAATCAETSGLVVVDSDVSDFGERAGLGLPVSELCRELGLPASTEKEREPVQAAHPVLVTSGEHDPVTPPRYGVALAEQLGAFEITVAGTGHGVLLSDCGLETLVAFFDDPQGAAGLGGCRDDDPIEIHPPF
ncbi:MAG: alpha/beta hydrolase [Myxococcales bacterium]|nr:alpha/beta hydrolase [Myxococcales bacterium]